MARHHTKLRHQVVNGGGPAGGPQRDLRRLGAVSLNMPRFTMESTKVVSEDVGHEVGNWAADPA